MLQLNILQRYVSWQTFCVALFFKFRVIHFKSESPEDLVLCTSWIMIHLSAPLSLPHTASRDVTVAGYTIPKDAFIIPNIYACHRDPDIWGDPDNFRPERWIGENGKLKSFPAFLPFSVGEWGCEIRSFLCHVRTEFHVAIVSTYILRSSNIWCVWNHYDNGACRPADIAGASTLIPRHADNSLPLTWKSNTRRWNRLKDRAPAEYVVPSIGHAPLQIL